LRPRFPRGRRVGGGQAGHQFLGQCRVLEEEPGRGYGSGRYGVDPYAAWAELGSQLAETDPQGRTDIAASFDRWEAAIEDGLRAMHASGQLVPEADPAALALATLAALQGGLLLTQMRRDTQPLETALDAMLTDVYPECHPRLTLGGNVFGTVNP